MIKRQLVVLSGPIASGKSTLGTLLLETYGAVRLKTNELIQTIRSAVPPKRRALQIAGEELDRETKGLWVRDALVRRLGELGDKGLVIVDAVRIGEQIEGIRAAFGPQVVHVHLTASPEELRRRYSKRPRKFEEMPSYEEVRESETERNVETLASVADVVINTDHCTDKDVLVRAAARLNLFPRDPPRLVDVIVGGQYGSEGKGNIVSYIGREYDYLMRVGGPNAGHKVYEEPKPYTFHSLPSGTRHSESRLIIGPGAVLSVPTLLREIAECQVSHKRLSIDPQSMVIDQQDIDFEEKDLKDTIGSTAQGVGAASARRINERKPKELGSSVRLAKDIAEFKPYLRPTREVLESAYASGSRILLEGTQGTSLSLYHGHYPHVTSRDTTVSGCLAEAGIPPHMVRRAIMVCRTYPIRVGNAARGKSGPMSGEISLKAISERSDIPYDELLQTERTSTTNRERRIGEFDWVQLRRSILLNAPTDIALTFVDYLSIRNRNARRFEQLQEDTIRFIEEVEHVSGVPISLISTRFHSRCIIDRRAW